MPTDDQFNEAKEYVLDRINHYSTVHLEITGDKVLGEDVWKDGKLKTQGLGLGAGRRLDLQNDINAWLKQRPHSRLLHGEYVAADVTVEDLVNYVAYSLT
jgi:hypothetical protein